MTILDKAKMIKVDEVVWCDSLVEVHSNSLNPYGMGPESYCRPEDHRPVYYRAKKGDDDGQVAEAEADHSGARR